MSPAVETAQPRRMRRNLPPRDSRPVQVPARGVPCTCPVGTGNGHRVAHCHCRCSPYDNTGYDLEEAEERFDDQPQPPKVNIAKAARALPKAERRTYLQERGWYRLSRHGAETWFAPGWQRDARSTEVVTNEVYVALLTPAGSDR